MIRIEKERCIGCGACIKDCPASAIRMTEEKAEAYKDCLLCGHCVAICPSEAVSIPEYDMEDVEAYDKDTFTLKAEYYLHAVSSAEASATSSRKRLSARRQKDTKGRPLYCHRQEPAGVYIRIYPEQLDEFKELVWKEMPSILEELKQNAPDYARAFELFYLKWKRNPKDDTFFSIRPPFLSSPPIIL